jgi:hypothetical protein
MPRGRRRKHVRNTRGLRNQGSRPGQPPTEVTVNSDCHSLFELERQHIAEHLPNDLPESILPTDVDSEDEDAS